MDLLNKVIGIYNTVVWTYLILTLALGLGLYFSFKTKFVQFRFLKKMVRLVSQSSQAKASDKTISSFQSLCIACGGCIGTGNVAGVAMAIVAGGPGAVFWMWVLGLLGAGTSFIENTLAQVYKEQEKNDVGFRGGPAFYMEKGLKKRWMGILFAVCMILSFGYALAALQANTIAQAFTQAFGLPEIVCGLVICILAAVVIFGGTKRIARVSEIGVPLMAIAYLGVSLFILVKNYQLVPGMFASIFQGAFGIRAVAGGGVGAAIINGVKRGVFSSGAGQGDSPHAAAAATVSHPAKQGLIQSFAIYVDTILVCSATALVVCTSGVYENNRLSGIQLVQESFSSLVGGWAAVFIACCMLLFCFSSIIANYYYAESNLLYIMRDERLRTPYRISFILVLLWGALSGLQIVWDIADAFGGTLAVVNMIALAMLSGVAFRVLEDYERKLKTDAEPVFAARNIPGLENADCWEQAEDGLNQEDRSVPASINLENTD